jgi:hypothetical protein
MNAPPSTLQACSTPGPQKAAVFNVAEYKRQQALKQSPPSAKKADAGKPAAPVAAAAALKAKPAAAVAPVAQPKTAVAATAPAGEAGAGVVDLANPGTPMMKVEVRQSAGRSCVGRGLSLTSVSFLQARFDFKGDAGKKEMSFEKGDYITVYGKSHMEGWWVGRLQGSKETLYLPFNYVKLVKKFV